MGVVSPKRTQGQATIFPLFMKEYIKQGIGIGIGIGIAEFVGSLPIGAVLLLLVVIGVFAFPVIPLVLALIGIGLLMLVVAPFLVTGFCYSIAHGPWGWRVFYAIALGPLTGICVLRPEVPDSGAGVQFLMFSYALGTWSILNAIYLAFRVSEYLEHRRKNPRVGRCRLSLAEYNDWLAKQQAAGDKNQLKLKTTRRDSAGRYCKATK